MLKGRHRELLLKKPLLKYSTSWVLMQSELVDLVIPMLLSVGKTKILLRYYTSEQAYFAGPPPQQRFAALGSQLVLDADLKTGASKVFTLSSSSQASYRLRRVFYASHQKLRAHSFRCSSFPTAIRCAAVGGFAALRMRRAPCGCFAGFVVGLDIGRRSVPRKRSHHPKEGDRHSLSPSFHAFKCSFPRKRNRQEAEGL